MSEFTPGKIIKEFRTKSGKNATLVYPKIESVFQLLTFINTLSAEDTFIRFSGEQQTLEEEEKYYAATFVKMAAHKAVYIHCFIENTLVGVCEVANLPALKKRGEHVGRLGLVVAQEYRGDGVGFELITATISEASKEISNLKMIQLECSHTNDKALNLYKKVGFKEVGRLPKYILYHGEYIDEVEMVLGVNGWSF